MKPEFETLGCCPVCGSGFSTAFSAKDYLVTKEMFSVVKCHGCSLLFTNPRPVQSIISRYYNSSEYISHSGTGKGLIPGLYNLVKRINIAGKCRLTKRLAGVSHGSVLDYGCGRGDFLAAMSQRGWNITGIEPDATAAAVAASVCRIAIRPPEDLKTLDKGGFDVITLWHVLEHVHNLNETVAMLKEKLKEGGRLIIALPNHLSYDARYYENVWAAYDVPRHLYHFNKKSMKTLAEKFGMRMLEVKPMRFDAFYVSMLSEKYRGNPLAIIGGAWRGLVSNLSAMGNSEWSSLIYVFKSNTQT